MLYGITANGIRHSFEEMYIVKYFEEPIGSQQKAGDLSCVSFP